MNRPSWLTAAYNPGFHFASPKLVAVRFRQLIEENADLKIGEALRMLVFGPMGVQRMTPSESLILNQSFAEL